jgi:hypothetical protein
MSNEERRDRQFQQLVLENLLRSAHALTRWRRPYRAGWRDNGDIGNQADLSFEKAWLQCITLFAAPLD